MLVDRYFQIQYVNRGDMAEDKVSEQINIRFPVGVVDEIDKRIASGNFRGRADFVLAAVRFYLDRLDFFDHCKLISESPDDDPIELKSPSDHIP